MDAADGAAAEDPAGVLRQPTAGSNRRRGTLLPPRREDAVGLRNGMGAGGPFLARRQPRAAPLPPLLLVHLGGAWIGASAQLLLTVTQWKNAHSGMAQAQTALLALLLFAVAICTSIWPNLYDRHRTWFTCVARTAIYIVPTCRQTGVGAALLLERAPRAGWWGACADAARILSGTRLLGLAVGGLVQSFPPGGTLLTQLPLLYLTSNSQGYCQTELLRHPDTQQRMQMLATTFEIASMPAMMLPGAIHLGTLDMVGGHAPAEAVCQATLSFVQLALSSILPTLLVVYCWHAPPALPVEPWRGAAGINGWKAWLFAQAARALSAVDAMLYDVFGTHNGYMASGITSWWLLAMGWLVCKTVAGLA